MDDLFWDERLTLLYRTWCEKKGARAAPTRDDFDPAEIFALMPIMHLIDVIREPLGFRHRLVGTELVERMGRDVTGRWVDADTYGEAAAEIFDGLKIIATEVRPYRRRARLDWHKQHWLTTEAVEMPLLGPDGEVNMVLRGATFFVRAERLPERLEFMPLAA
ncbi:MAG: PAS domain-containing protein [Parvibaculum sp.]|uniref:PAS domain-containing protein n=1 Tax=Parvibaculum sp. TaxID=2024848 RepID=UPI00262C956A|nr:PAS domain-containing protein [Parvibaculum sp.]MBX3496603.1 PAS domain-containing protein [Parvibaculum sp.]MCW5727160.1 PAS domain-containing protein [Parvibaculum sp.]